MQIFKQLKLKILGNSIDSIISQQLDDIANEIHYINIYKNSLKIILMPILIPQSALVYHWVGMVLEKEGNNLRVIYFDFENKPIIKELEQGLGKYLHILNSNYSIAFQQLVVEQQKYDNCGPEVIENFIFYLTGNRVSQEDAISLHFKLLKDSLVNNSV